LICRPGLATFNAHTKFEVSTITCYKDMKGNAECRNLWWFGVVRGHSRSSAMSPFDKAHTRYDFLINFNINTTHTTVLNYVSIFYCSRVMVSYLLKVANFNLAHLQLVPPLGVTPFEFYHDLWHQKTGVPGLSFDAVCGILHLAISVEHQLVTDSQTKHDYGIYCTSMASRGKKETQHK